LQSVRPAEFYSAESNTPDRMSGSRTGHSPVFRFGNTPFQPGHEGGLEISASSVWSFSWRSFKV
jgi:hypothetical protein